MVLVLVSCFALSGCLAPKMYVDTSVPTVGKGDIVGPAQPAPVQVLYEFHTKGAANSGATSQTRPYVIDAATQSGLFSMVSATPVSGGVLTVTINNVADTDDAMSKGIGTGLTMGLVGTMVKDGYVCAATYTRDGKTTDASVHHAIYTTIGNHDGPPGMTPLDPQAAVQKMIGQATWNLLKQLADKHAFE